MKQILLYIVLFFFLVSCSFSPNTKLKVSLYSEIPWEQITGDPMWYKVKYFDGKRVVTEYLEEDEKNFTIEVESTTLVLICLYPLGTLSPFGGYWERGRKKTVYLYGEYGNFMNMLLEAAEVMPKAIKELSLLALMKDYPDLNSIDRSSFLSSLYEGRINKKTIKIAKRYNIEVTGLLSGRWHSLYSASQSFDYTSSSSVTLNLYPGVWYYLCNERNRIFEIVITEDGNYWTKLKEKPRWN